MDTVDQIKSRLSIEEVVSQYVQLKKVGSSYKGLCPFHKEKTPSFMVSPQKQLAYCFGCHKGGDMFTFIQEVENVDFREAINILAEKAGVQVVQTASGKGGRFSKDKKEILMEINEAAADFFEEKLWADEGKLSYVRDRGLADETIRQFKLGYAADSFELLHNFLIKKGYDETDIMSAGLLSQKSETGETARVYDRFRDRIMFPIWNHRGRIVGFTGRVLNPASQPKYLNSPDTPIYNKSDILYGFHQAKEAIKDHNEVILVEGNMDVIASSQAGIKNVVASSGTAVTEQQLRFLQRFSKHLFISFDNDEAGISAIMRAIALCQKLEFDARIVQLGNFKDPDEMIKSAGTQWNEAVSQAAAYFHFCMDRQQHLLEKGDVSKREALRALLELVKRVKSPIDQDAYIQQLAGRFLVKPEALYQEMRQIRLFSDQENKQELSSPEKFSAEEYFWAMCLEYFELFLELIEKFPPHLVSGEFQQLYDFVKNLSKDRFQLEEALSRLNEDSMHRLKIVMLNIENRFEDASDEIRRAELIKLIDKIHQHHYDKVRKTVLMNMKQAKVAGDTERLNKLFQEYHELLAKTPFKSEL